jgi:transcriptional regulator with XRE-family HTH domain
MSEEILILSGISEGQKVKLTRLAKGFRQIDLASIAKENPIDITRLEKGRYVLPTRRKRILEALGMEVKKDSGETII